jgi:hypothetical protein
LEDAGERRVAAGGTLASGRRNQVAQRPLLIVQAVEAGL